MQVESKAILANSRPIALNIDLLILYIAFLRHKPNRNALNGFQLKEKARFETRARRGKRESNENRGTKKSMEAIPKRRTNAKDLV